MKKVYLRMNTLIFALLTPIMTKHYFHHPLVDLHYYKFGNGPKAMLCFHGYGMHGRQFASFEADLGDQYTFYSFDMFFHEGTRLNDVSLNNLELGLSKEQLINIITKFCEENAIRSFSILAYSIGTACAGVLMESNQFQIERAILIAPAFLAIPEFLASLGHPGWKNRRFRQFMYSEYAINFSLRLANWLGYLDKESYPIIKKELGNFELRHMFYATVTFLRKIRPDIKQLVNEINQQKIPVMMVYGKHDHHFPASIGVKFEAQLNSVKQIVVNKGHDMVDAELSRQIRIML